MIFYMIYYRNFACERQRMSVGVDEVIIAACVIMMFPLEYRRGVMELKYKNGIGWFIIGAILFSVLKNLVVILYFGASHVRQRMREVFDAEDQERDSASTSDFDPEPRIPTPDFSDSDDDLELERQRVREQYYLE